MFGSGQFKLRSQIGVIFGGVLSASCLIFAASAFAEGETLKIYTSSGAYKLSQTEAFFKPYEETTGTKIMAEAQGGALKLLKKWKDGSEPEADVLNLSSFEAEQACNQGLLSAFSAQDIAPAPNGIKVDRDFMENSLMDCAVPNVAWSALLVVKPRKFPNKKPRGWADFFNAKDFPGKRSLRKSARHTMEMALLSAGVNRKDIYENLASIEGQKKAFAKLDGLKEQIVWWESGAEAIDHLKSDEVCMGVAYNGRLFNAIIGDGLDVQLVWQEQIYDFDYWAVPLNAKHQEQAKDFVKFATAPERLASQASWMPYGPMRASSLQFIKEHAIGKMHMGPYIPTSRAHFKTALKFNEGWWQSEEGRVLEARFQDWLSGSLTWPEEDKN